MIFVASFVLISTRGSSGSTPLSTTRERNGRASLNWMPPAVGVVITKGISVSYKHNPCYCDKWIKRVNGRRSNVTGIGVSTNKSVTGAAAANGQQISGSVRRSAVRVKSLGGDGFARRIVSVDGIQLNLDCSPGFKIAYSIHKSLPS